MFTIIGWLIYGVIVGMVGKLIVSFLPIPTPYDIGGKITLGPTVLVGIIGSYVGGLISYILGSGEPFSSSGFLLGVVGACITLVTYGYAKNKGYV